MERIQQLPPDVQIPAEKLTKLTKVGAWLGSAPFLPSSPRFRVARQVTLITIAELSKEFTDAQNNVTNDQSIAAAITFARKLRSIRKVRSASSALNRGQRDQRGTMGLTLNGTKKQVPAS